MHLNSLKNPIITKSEKPLGTRKLRNAEDTLEHKILGI